MGLAARTWLNYNLYRRDDTAELSGSRAVA